jgi:hypothetical protein
MINDVIMREMGAKRGRVEEKRSPVATGPSAPWGSTRLAQAASRSLG